MGPVPDEDRVLRGLLSRPWCYGASSRLPASSLHWIVSVPQLDPCLEVDIQQF